MSRRPYLSKKLRQRLTRKAGNRCGYCLASQSFFSSLLNIEHIQPLVRGGTSQEDNLWLRCQACNLHKSSKPHGVDPQIGKTAPLFNPQQQNWNKHFKWTRNGARVVGKTSIGRATVEALRMNDELAITARRSWIAAKKFPPKDSLK